MNLLKAILVRFIASAMLRQLLSGSFWNMLSSVAAQGASFVASVLLSRMVGQEVFGEYSLIRTTINTITIYATFGFTFTMTKYVAEWLVTDKERVGRVIALCYAFSTASGLAFSLGIYLAAPAICRTMFSAPDLTVPLRIGIAALFFQVYVASQMGLLSGFQSFRTLATTNMISGLSTIPLLLGGAYFFGLNGAVAALSLTAMINAILNGCFIRMRLKAENIHLDFRTCVRECPIIWQFALPAAMMGILSGTFAWGCQVVIANQPDGLNELAVVAAAIQICYILRFVQIQTSRVFLASISQAYAEKNIRKTWKIAGISLLVNCVMVSIAAAVIIPLAGYILSFYGESFARGRTVLILLCIASIFYALESVVYLQLSARGKIWFYSTVTLFASLAQFVVTCAFASYGTAGIGFGIGEIGKYMIHIAFGLSYLIFLDRMRKNRLEADS